jgi:hypothetical protein
MHVFLITKLSHHCLFKSWKICWVIIFFFNLFLSAVIYLGINLSKVIFFCLYLILFFLSEFTCTTQIIWFYFYLNLYELLIICLVAILQKLLGSFSIFILIYLTLASMLRIIFKMRWYEAKLSITLPLFPQINLKCFAVFLSFKILLLYIFIKFDRNYQSRVECKSHYVAKECN